LFSSLWRSSASSPGSDPRRFHGCDGKTIRSGSAGSPRHRPTKEDT
jgi:hypothetical protein